MEEPKMKEKKHPAFNTKAKPLCQDRALSVLINNAYHVATQTQKEKPKRFDCLFQLSLTIKNISGRTIPTPGRCQRAWGGGKSATSNFG